MHCKCLRVACLAALLTISPLALAFQTLVAGAVVTIEPRVKPAAPESQPVLRVDSSLVLIAAHVTTATGACVMNLGRENFQLTEDNVGQTIAHFSKDDAAVSVGILFDVSRSMTKKMQVASQAVAAFFRTANPEDEFFLVEFSERAKLAIPFTPDSEELYRHIAHVKPWGRTSLLDAVHLALGQMKQARNSRRAIVIFSDGGDNRSRHTVREVRNALLESDVQVYAMGIFDTGGWDKSTAEERNGPALLDELAEQSGGRHYRVRNLNDLPSISEAIGNELRNEYLLGYYPSNVSRDGRYRQVKVKLVIPGTLHDLRLYYRRGYYSPSQ